jgi:hypothetical protein
MAYLKSANIQVPIGLKFYFYKSKVFDGDNTGFFWGKFIQDLMVKHYGLLKDDNIRYIKPIMYNGEEKEKDKTDKNVKLDLLLTIYYKTNEDKMD